MKTIPGPDPNTRRPRFAMPIGACDAHCHVFGPAHRFAYAPKRAYTPPDAPFEDLRRLHGTLGIERGVIVHASCHGTDNRVTLDAIAHSNGRYRGVAMIDETHDDQELARMHQGGIRGVRFNFVKHLGGRPDFGFFRRVVDRIKPLGWHLVLHLDAEDLAEFQTLFAGLPVPLIIDHMGRVSAAHGMDQRPFRILLEAMKLDHCWVKICGAERVSAAGPPFVDAAPFARALVAAAPDRVLWGTDWPHPNVKHMPNDGDLVDLLPLMIDDPMLLHRILVENPARLYGF